MRRSIALFGALATAVALLAGCSSSPAPTATTTAAVAEPTAAATTPAERVTVTIASLKGPTTMGLAGLMQQADAGEGLQDYDVTVYGTPDEVVPLVVKGDVDIALVPANLASVIYNQTKTDAGAAVQVATVNTLGVLSVLENGETVSSLADLRGKTVYSTGKGASPEFVLNHLLTQAGLTPGTDVTVEYKSEATEVAAVLAATPGAVGVLPQPFATAVTKQNPAVRVAVDLTDAWTELGNDSQLVTGVTVVRADFATEHPQALADFLTDYEASVAFTNDDPAAAADLIVAAGIVQAAPIAQAAIPASHIVFLTGDDMRSALEGYLEVLFAANPQSVGGAMPSDDFYLGAAG
jgi:NitT/TauT family transport system substrate-binding protein